MMLSLKKKKTRGNGILILIYLLFIMRCLQSSWGSGDNLFFPFLFSPLFSHRFLKERKEKEKIDMGKGEGGKKGKR